MKVIFFGSSDFSVPILKALREKEEVVLVVTQPDRKKGRSLKLSCTPVKIIAKELRIKTFQPDKVNSHESLEYLRRFSVDIFVVVSFGEILRKELLDIPSMYSLNVHASLLPKYRGAAPINWAIANGEKETGLTVIKMNEKMDEGDIVLQDTLTIDNEDDAITLSKKLSEKAGLLLARSIDLIKSGGVSFIKQDNSRATYAPKLRKEDGLIDWRMSVDQILNRMKAFVPWPGCFTYWNGKILKIWKARQDKTSDYKTSMPGTVLGINKDTILISTGKGVLGIEELQLEGRRRMYIKEFIIGHKEFTPGSIFLLKN